MLRKKKTIYDHCKDGIHSRRKCLHDDIVTGAQAAQAGHCTHFGKNSQGRCFRRRGLQTISDGYFTAVWIKFKLMMMTGRWVLYWITLHGNKSVPENGNGPWICLHILDFNLKKKITQFSSQCIFVCHSRIRAWFCFSCWGKLWREKVGPNGNEIQILQQVG